ncbi:MAG: hypothetical protein NTV76_08950 [Pseudomonas sp.]|nr:hypothetical protein [Pseudomonas sp.]
MASTLLTSAKHGAYVAIGLYMAMILMVTLSGQTQHAIEPPIQVAYPGVQFERHAQSITAEHADVAGLVGQ